MNNKTYTAITIGPIYDTFSQARRTRAIWAASYFFSLFIRKILEKAKEEKWEIMLPYNQQIYKGKHGAGLYADRLYFADKNRSDVTGILNQVIDFFADDFVIQKLTTDKKIAKDFLTNYLNLHMIEISLLDVEMNKIKNEKDEHGKSCNSVLKILNNLLDNQELKKNYVFDFEKNYIIDYFSKEWNAETEIKNDAFGNDKERNFKSVGEIATNDLFQKNKIEYEKLLKDSFKNEDIELIDKLKITLKESFRDYHKYYAVLYADGDNIGDLLNSVANEDDKLQTFSEKLLEFGIKAEKTIQEYGGSAIYLGGEDIFAFLPIAFNKNNQLFTLAHLIYNLDKDFDATIGEYARQQEVTVPTLSYGLMLAYYKFPMREAMNQAHELLESCKRDFKKTGKNAIGVRFQKHSGQYMECFIEKGKKQSTKLIYELLTQHIQIKDKKDTLSGLIQRFKDDVFFTAFMIALRKNRIDAFFKNFFNEDIHYEKAEFIDYFSELVQALSSDYLTDTEIKSEIEKENENFKKIIFTVILYYQFIQPKKHKKDE